MASYMADERYKLKEITCVKCGKMGDVPQFWTQTQCIDCVQALFEKVKQASALPFRRAPERMYVQVSSLFIFKIIQSGGQA